MDSSNDSPGSPLTFQASDYKPLHPEPELPNIIYDFPASTWRELLRHAIGTHLFRKPAMSLPSLSSETRSAAIPEAELKLEHTDCRPLSLIVFVPDMHTRMTKAMEDHPNYSLFLQTQEQAHLSAQQSLAQRIHPSETCNMLSSMLHTKRCVREWVSNVVLFPALALLHGFQNPTLLAPALKMCIGPCFVKIPGEKDELTPDYQLLPIPDDPNSSISAYELKMPNEMPPDCFDVLERLSSAMSSELESRDIHEFMFPFQWPKEDAKTEMLTSFDKIMIRHWSQLETLDVHTGLITCFDSTVFTYQPRANQGVLYVSKQIPIDELSVLDLAAFVAFSLGLLQVEFGASSSSPILETEQARALMEGVLQGSHGGLPARFFNSMGIDTDELVKCGDQLYNLSLAPGEGSKDRKHDRISSEDADVPGTGDEKRSTKKLKADQDL